MRRGFTLTIFILCLGFIVSLITSNIVSSLSIENFFTDVTPTNLFEIFRHNFFFLFLYSIPCVGVVYFIYSFTLIFISIGLSFHWTGILNTSLKLLHLPLELFAFSTMVVFSFTPLYKRALPFAVSTIILFIAAFIEFNI